MTTLLRPTLMHPSENGRPKGLARTRTLMGFQIIGTGSYVPDNIVTNDHLAELYGFDTNWIVQRTGIRERRHAPPEIATSDMCTIAAERCIKSAGVDRDDIDLLIVGTFTPDMAFPSTACMVQDRLGLHCGAFDVQAACAGFMYSLAIGAQFVNSGNAELCLIIGGDCNSRVTNPKDQKTYPLFGDGAGAVLLKKGSDNQGFLAYQLGADGGGGSLLNRPACGSKMPPSREAIDQELHFMHMDGRAVFRWAVNTVTDSTTEVLNYAGLTADDIHLFMPHQANIRIINAVSDVLGFPRERVVNNLDRYGNTSAASIPLVMDETIKAGRIRRGDTLLMSGFGAGLTWASAVLSW